MRSTPRLAILALLLLLPSFAILATPESTDGFDVPDELGQATAPAPKQSESNTLLLPYFRTVLGDPNAETTLFAVRNNGGSPLTVRFTYVVPDSGVPPKIEEEIIPAHGVRSVNTRLVSALPNNTGISIGYLRVEALGESLPAGVISGDYFRVTPSADAANGGAMLPIEAAACKSWSHRFFSGGDFNGGSRIAFLAFNRPAQGPTVVGNVYNEAGDLIHTVPLTLASEVLEVSDIDLDLPASFGSIDWVFQGDAQGVVTTTFTASERFSVGVDAACVDGVGGGPDPEPNAVVFELPGNFFTCNRCENFQHNMPIPGGRRDFSKVIVDFDVFVAGFDTNRPSGFHCLFWLNNGTQWPDMMGYLNWRGTRNLTVFQSNGPFGFPPGMERVKSPGVLGGETYHVHYEYDTIEKVVFYEIRRPNGELRVADSFALPNNVRPLSTSFTFIQFGTQAGEVESRTERWRWSNFRAQLIPAE